MRRLELIKESFLRQRWGQLIARTAYQMGADNAGDMAASVAYYALLSLFPLAIGVIAVLGFLIPSEAVQAELFAFFERNLPTSTGLLQDNIASIIDVRGTLGVLSLVGLFWSGSAIFGSIGRAMDRAWGVEQSQPIYITKPRDILLSAGTGVLFFVSLALTSVSSLVPSANLPFGATTTAIVTQALSFLLVLSVVLLIYRFMPNATVYWRDIWPGALLASIILVVLQSGFSLYVTRFANFQLVYGSIASVIALLLWIYASAFVLILGIEFSSEYAKIRKYGWYGGDAIY